MITAAQQTRLNSIIENLHRWRLHPNPKVSAAAAEYSPEQIQTAIRTIGEIVESEDGYQAFRIISSWHMASEKGVMDKLLEVGQHAEQK